MHANNPGATTLLTVAELNAMDARIAANFQRWLADHIEPPKVKPPRKLKSPTGPKPKTIINPFYGFIGSMTAWERYPRFAMDIIEGIARLDWHDRRTGANGKSMPLSVYNLALMLECLQVITNESIEDLLNLKERHARRYLTAINLIIPWMMKSRPTALLDYMEGINSTQRTNEWEDCDEFNTPSPDELEKLHHDLRTLTQYKSAEEYELQMRSDSYNPTIMQLPKRLEHPMKTEVMQMLKDGALANSISRATGVDRKTIKKWHAEARELETSQPA